MNKENKPKITTLVAARMGSQRFPGKTLADLNGKPMLERQIERIKKSKYVDQIVVATTTNNEDDLIVRWCENNEINYFNGPCKDVLGRLFQAATFFSSEIIIEILGDNPLVHSEMIDSIVNIYLNNSFDYVANLTSEYPETERTSQFPRGVRVQVFSYETLRKCESLAKDEFHREHATSYIASNPDIFSTGFLKAKDCYVNCNRPDVNLAVNEQKHLLLVSKIFELCKDYESNFSLNDIINVLDENPELLKLM